MSPDAKQDVHDEHEQDDDESELLRPRDHRVLILTASAGATAVKKDPPYWGVSL
jgi:hypothetical protein